MRLIARAMACLVLIPGLASATDAPPEPGRGRDFVALGVGTRPDYLGSQDYRVSPFGYATYRVGDVRYTWQGLALKADFLRLRTGGDWVGGVVARYVPGRHDVKNDAVDRLPDIAGTVEVGGFLGRRFGGIFRKDDAVSVSLGTRVDIGGVYSGYTLDFGVDYDSPLSKRVRALVNLGAVYASDGFMEAQFGVDARDAQVSGLPAFQAKAGFYEVSASAGMNFQVNRRWGIFGQLVYARLTGDARDSPVVRSGGDPNQWQLGLALSYRLD